MPIHCGLVAELVERVSIGLDSCSFGCLSGMVSGCLPGSWEQKSGVSVEVVELPGGIVAFVGVGLGSESLKKEYYFFQQGGGRNTCHLENKILSCHTRNKCRKGDGKYSSFRSGRFLFC